MSAAYDLRPVRVRCPVCLEADGELLFTLDSDQATTMALLADRDPERADTLRDHIASLWGAPECRIVRCRSCTFEFADPFVAGDARFYELIYEDFEYAGHKWDWDVTAERLRALTAGRDPQDTELLEIGAGSGAFLRKVVPDVVAPEQVVCTEFNSQALEKLRALGVQAIAGDFRALEGASYEGRFSFLCLFHVLEHLDALDVVFERLTRLARPDAHLFVSLPNPVNAAFYESQDIWIEWAPHHVGRWTERAFEVMGERFGWQVVDHRVEPVGAVEFLKLFAFNRLIQKSREPGSLGRRIRTIGDRRLRQAALAPLVLAGCLRGLPLLPRLRQQQLGRSHWVEMRRR